MKNDIVIGKCVDMSVDGLGIARCDDLVVFVKGLIKDEVAQIRITKEKKNYAYGIIDKLLQASEYRRDFDCPVAYKCGGCDLRHIDYQYQLQLKKSLLDNILNPYNVLDIIQDDNPYYYRNKIQIPYKNGKMGFYRKYSNDIVEFDDCLIESKMANKIISDLKTLTYNKQKYDCIRHFVIKHASSTDEIMLAIISNDFNLDCSEIIDYITLKYPQIKSIILNLNDKDTNVILGDKEKILYGDSYICDIYDDIKVKISLKSFYQVNHKMMIKLYQKILQLADLNKNDVLLDLFCGIGTISLYLAKHCKHVTGIEIVKQAIDNARDNAIINNIDNVDFIVADASKKIDEYLIGKDVIVVDPPRKGLSRTLIDSFLNNDIKKIVYVSCNPNSLKRDLQLLEDQYYISDISAFDMFPYTVHVETVVKLSQKHIDHSIRVELDLDKLEDTTF